MVLNEAKESSKFVRVLESEGVPGSCAQMSMQNGNVQSDKSMQVGAPRAVKWCLQAPWLIPGHEREVAWTPAGFRVPYTRPNLTLRG